MRGALFEGAINDRYAFARTGCSWAGSCCNVFTHWNDSYPASGGLREAN